MRNENEIENEILKRLDERNKKAVEFLLKDEEICYLQELSNKVSSVRLYHNDHGPLHMKMAGLNSVIMAQLLGSANIPLTIQSENNGDFNDGVLAVFTATFLHDIGMSITRDNHENSGMAIALPIIDRFLSYVFEDDHKRRIILRSLILEGIMGHMTTIRISSLEAGIVLVADGCDMERGRARLPMPGDTTGKYGDIHMYSSLAVEKVDIIKGTEKPICIRIKLSESVGYFQVEEVLLNKISGSTIKDYIELYSEINGSELKRYL